jgi:Zn finger protein HypA/HybF involved in hydrogenase expression
MELKCLECQTKYELDLHSNCPNCSSEKSKVLSEMEPWYIKHIYLVTFIAADLALLGYFLLKRLI